MISKPVDYMHREFYICDCSSPQHMLVCTVYDWAKGETNTDHMVPNADQNVAFSFDMHLSTYLGFWGRLKYAFLYLFGYKSKFGPFDNIDLQYSDVIKLEDQIALYKKLVLEYEVKLEAGRNIPCSNPQVSSNTAQA